MLTYHVVSGEVLAASLSGGQQVTTLQGQNVGVTILGDRVFINGAEVTAADVLASNGVVHLINRVLLPAGTDAKVARHAKHAKERRQSVVL